MVWQLRLSESLFSSGNARSCKKSIANDLIFRYNRRMYKGKTAPVGCGKYMNCYRKKQFALFLAVCMLLQGCGRRQMQQDENTWSFQANDTEEEIRKDDSGIYHEYGETAEDTAEHPAEHQTEGYVYLCGAVKHPGVYEIHNGMRIFEVLELAGGMTDEADPFWINQAQTVNDGQMLQIYTKEETDRMRDSGMTAGNGQEGIVTGDDGDRAADAEASDDKININAAGREELMTLPGIGEAKAEAILQYRQEHGAFGSIEELCQISGIKEAVFSKIKDRITI